LTKKTEEGLSKMVQVTKKALNIDQNSNNQNQQGSEMHYSTQTGQYYDPNTINQPLIQNQGHTYQNIPHNPSGETQSNIQMNYPTFSNNAPNPSIQTNYQPKQI
jgi:hypothetical protein